MSGDIAIHKPQAYVLFAHAPMPGLLIFLYNLPHQWTYSIHNHTYTGKHIDEKITKLLPPSICFVVMEPTIYYNNCHYDEYPLLAISLHKFHILDYSW